MFDENYPKDGGRKGCDSLNECLLCRKAQTCVSTITFPYMRGHKVLQKKKNPPPPSVVKVTVCSMINVPALFNTPRKVICPLKRELQASQPR